MKQLRLDPLPSSFFPPIMPKVSSRKRKQREDAQAQTGVVLGDVRRGDVAEKDDEERALESALFGVPNPSTTQQKRRTREDEAMEDIDDSAVSLSGFTFCLINLAEFPSFSCFS